MKAKIYFIIISLCLPQLVMSQEYVLNQDIIEGAEKITDSHEDILLNGSLETKEGKTRLDRLDVQIGLNASGQMGLLTFAGSSAIEFIWQRNLTTLPGDDIDEDEQREVEIITNLDSSDSLFKTLYSEVDKFLNFQKLKRKKRKKIINLLRRDAEKFSNLISDLVYMPQIGDWYVGGFFKNYSFSTGVSLGAVSLGYNKRIRFRFKINKSPLLLSQTSDLTASQKSMELLMNKFNDLGNSSLQFNQFELKRVFAIHQFSKGLELGLFNISASKGVQIEYKKIKSSPNSAESISRKKKSFPIIKFMNESIISRYDRKVYDDSSDKLSLHQIRIKYATENGLDFSLASFEKAGTLEFHYKR
jgi:hypothetical protein